MSDSPPKPTPTELLNELRGFLAHKEDREVASHCVGLTALKDIPPRVTALMDQIRVISMDVEHWSDNTDKTTEIGFAIVNIRDMRRAVGQGLGTHGELIFECIKFHLLRLIEGAHLPWDTNAKLGPDGNKFGIAEFVDFRGARRVIDSLFKETIKGVPGLENCPRPIILLGTAIRGDVGNLADKEIAINFKSYPSLVGLLDMQEIYRNIQGLGPKANKIGIKQLCKDLGINVVVGQNAQGGDIVDAHTAANDAARTLICTITIILRKALSAFESLNKPSLQDVVSKIETGSQRNPKTLGGHRKYCWRCGRTDHMGSHDPDHSVSACTQPDDAVTCRHCIVARPRALIEHHESPHLPVGVGSHCQIWSGEQARIHDAHRHIDIHCFHEAYNEAKARKAKHEAVRVAHFANRGQLVSRSRSAGRGGSGCGGPPRSGAPSGTSAPRGFGGHGKSRGRGGRGGSSRSPANSAGPSEPSQPSQPSGRGGPPPQRR